MDSALDLLPSDLFAGRTVFVTGGGSGINFGIAQGFAHLGADLALCGRSAERLDAARRALVATSANVHTVAADVRDASALATAMEGAVDRLGRLDVLVCGAAGNFPAAAERISPNGFRSVVDIDLNGTFHACHAAFPALQASGGSIIAISAHQAQVPYAGQAHVCAAKAGVDQLVRTLALEWGRHGIRANAVAPGPVNGTEGVRRLLPGDHAERARKLVPLGRLAETSDIAAACVFLASPLAAFINGIVLDVDGGGGLGASGPWNALVACAMQGNSDGD